jgi:hypothetical protein
LHVYEGDVTRRFSLYEDDGTADTATNACRFSCVNGIHDGANRILRIEPKEGTYEGDFERIRLHFHGVDAVSEVLVNGGPKLKAKVEEFRLVEPVSRFDPFMPSVGNSPKVATLPFIEFDWDRGQAYEIRY